MSKKILLATTALVGLVASSAVAGDLNVTVSGKSKFEAGARHFSNTNSNQQFPVTANQESTAFFSTSKAAVNVTNKTDSLTYGASIRLQVATNQSNGTDKDSRMDRSHIFLDSEYGSVQLGTNVAASKLMQVTASDIASATGGVDGDYSDFLNFDVNQTGTQQYVSANGNSSFIYWGDAAITSVDTLSNRKDGSSESADKITYISPRVEGVQLGISYVPDLSNGGNSVDAATLYGTTGSNPVYMLEDNYMRVRNLWSFGLNYKNTFDEVMVELGATMDMGRSREKGQPYYYQVTSTGVSGAAVPGTSANSALTGNYKLRNLKTYSVGGMVAMRGFSFALSYSRDGKSSMPYGIVTSTNNMTTSTAYSTDTFKSSWWTTGLAYENGPMSVSLTYLSGKRGFSNVNLKSSVTSLGADYEVAPGLKPFAEVTYAKFSPKNSAATTAKATVFILGTRVKF